jgi:hypothetical protein
MPTDVGPLPLIAPEIASASGVCSKVSRVETSPGSIYGNVRACTVHTEIFSPIACVPGYRK